MKKYQSKASKFQEDTDRCRDLSENQRKVLEFCLDPDNMRLPTLKAVRHHMGYRSDNSVLKIFDSLCRKSRGFCKMRENSTKKFNQ